MGEGSRLARGPDLLGDSAPVTQIVTPSTCKVCTAPAANGTATVLPLRNLSERAV